MISAIVTILIAVSAVDASADVILSAEGLNATLKKMDRLKRTIESGAERERPDAWFQLGTEGDALATLINAEVASHGMQERELIDLALRRTKELGVGVTYNREKKKFFYDGAGFQQYLALAPRGAHAAEAEFALLSYQFYQSTGADPAAVTKAAAAKQRFLVRFPKFKDNAELSLFLAVDHRDLYRHYHQADDAANAEKYRLLTRREYQRIVHQYPGSEQASAARQPVSFRGARRENQPPLPRRRGVRLSSAADCLHACAARRFLLWPYFQSRTVRSSGQAERRSASHQRARDCASIIACITASERFSFFNEMRAAVSTL